MKKAFLFDMDGVIVNSEQVWHRHGRNFSHELYGAEVYRKMGDLVGVSLDHEYAAAKKHGFAMSLDEYYQRYDEQAAKMYAQAIITQGLEDLVQSIKALGYTTGIVSSSRRPWIEIVLDKIGDRSLFDYTVSLNEKGLPSKPSPQGYLHAMQELGATPATTIILEDSNNGIKAAKASGAFVIGFTPLLVEGYVQNVPVDATAHSFADVIAIVRQREEVYSPL